MSRPVTIYAEMTPNPSTMKFVADIMLISDHEFVEFLSIEECKNHSSFAEALFNFPFVKGIFLASNFVSVTKSDVVEWSDVMNEMREFIRDWLSDNEIAIENIPEASLIEESYDNGNEAMPTKQEINTDLDKSIVKLLDEYVTPAVESDGGAILFQSFNEETGIVTLVLKGACSGCPSSTATLKMGIESLLKEHIPEVVEVVAMEG